MSDYASVLLFKWRFLPPQAVSALVTAPLVPLVCWVDARYLNPAAAAAAAETARRGGGGAEPEPEVSA